MALLAGSGIIQQLLRTVQRILSQYFEHFPWQIASNPTGRTEFMDTLSPLICHHAFQNLAPNLAKFVVLRCSHL